MTRTKMIHDEAMEHLSEARQTMKKLMTCTSDWSAGVLLEIDFDNLEEACREFGNCQLGLVKQGINRANTLRM